MPCTGSWKSGDSTMLSCLSPRRPCCGPKAAVSLMSPQAKSASSECVRSCVTEAGCASKATRRPASGARSAPSARSRSMPNFMVAEAYSAHSRASGNPERPRRSSEELGPRFRGDERCSFGFTGNQTRLGKAQAQSHRHDGNPACPADAPMPNMICSRSFPRSPSRDRGANRPSMAGSTTRSSSSSACNV